MEQMGKLLVKIFAIFAFMYITATPVIAIADVLQGELFGYRLGDKYPVSDDTKGSQLFFNNTYELVAENPIKPEVIGEVRLITSMKSFTIVGIIAITEFENYREAKGFSLDYETFLKAKYPEEKLENNRPLDGLIIKLNDKYQLSTFVTQVDESVPEKYKTDKKENEKLFFQVSLNFIDASEVKDLIEKEYKELLLEEAEKEGLTKGH